MKRRIVFIALGVIFAVSVAMILYFLRSRVPISHSTVRIQSEASEGTGEDPFARKRYEWLRLHDPATKEIPKNIRRQELEFVKRLAKRTDLLQRPVTAEWVAKGPYNIGVRTRALAVDVKDESILLAGGVSGGMWKSTEGGKNWRKTTAPDQLHSVSCIAQNRAPGKEHIWYYGTGEHYSRGGTAAHPTFSDAYYRGDGIFKSSDGGESWSRLPSTVSGPPEAEDPFDYVFGLGTFGQDGVLAATANGRFRSTDGGMSWQHVLQDLKTQLWKYDRRVGWTNLTANLPWGGELITYGGHMMIVRVKPDDENVLF